MQTKRSWNIWKVLLRKPEPNQSPIPLSSRKEPGWRVSRPGRTAAAMLLCSFGLGARTRRSELREVERQRAAAGRMSGWCVCTGMQPGLQARWFHHEDHEGHEEGNSVVNDPLFEYPPLCCFSGRVGRRLPWTLEAAGISSQRFHGHDPPFVVFVLFVVNANRRPMPPSRGRSLYKADMRPLGCWGRKFAQQKIAKAAKGAFVHFFAFAPPLGRSPMVTLPV